MSYSESFDRKAYAKGVEKGEANVDQRALSTIAELLSKPRKNAMVKLSDTIVVNASFTARVEKDDGCCFVYMQDGTFFQVKPAKAVTLDELFEELFNSLQF